MDEIDVVGVDGLLLFFGIFDWMGAAFDGTLCRAGIYARHLGGRAMHIGGHKCPPYAVSLDNK
jgi:hypothetical protein